MRGGETLEIVMSWFIGGAHITFLLEGLDRGSLYVVQQGNGFVYVCLSAVHSSISVPIRFMPLL